MGAALTAYTPITNDSPRPFLVYLAEVLYDAGLLAPELPEDKFGVWRVSDTCGTYSSPAPDDVDNVWSYRGRVFFEPNWESEYANQSYVGNYTPHKARKVALALLAAANHLEREQS